MRVIDHVGKRQLILEMIFKNHVDFREGHRTAEVNRRGTLRQSAHHGVLLHRRQADARIHGGHHVPPRGRHCNHEPKTYAPARRLHVSHRRCRSGAYRLRGGR